MDSTELTYSTAALGKCIHKGHVGKKSCLQAVGMRTNREKSEHDRTRQVRWIYIIYCTNTHTGTRR